LVAFHSKENVDGDGGRAYFEINRTHVTTMRLHLYMSFEPISPTRPFTAVCVIGGERAVVARRRIRVS